MLQGSRIMAIRKERAAMLETAGGKELSIYVHELYKSKRQFSARPCGTTRYTAGLLAKGGTIHDYVAGRRD